MSLLQQQNVLAKLCTDSAFRETFYSKPDEVGCEMGLTESEIAELSQSAKTEVQRFSRSLIGKRLREAAKIIPSTRGLMDDEFETAFFDFAPSFNPKGIKKHFEDALEFCKYLQKTNSTSEAIKKSARFESTSLTFFNENKRIAVCRLGPGFLSFAVWLRAGGRVFHFTL